MGVGLFCVYKEDYTKKTKKVAMIYILSTKHFRLITI